MVAFRLDQVPSFGVISIAKSLKNRSGDVTAALAAAKLPDDLLQSPPASVSVSSEAALLDIGMQQTKDVLFAARCGCDFQSRSTTLASHIVHNSATLKEALSNAVRFARLMRPNAKLVEKSDHLGHMLEIGTVSSEVPFRSSHAEFVLAALVATMSSLSRVSATKVVRFSHERSPETVTGLAGLLGHKLQMSCSSTGILFDRKMLASPIPQADATLLPHLTMHADRLLQDLPAISGVVSTRVQELIYQNLRNTFKIDAAAIELGMSVSTLSRRLRQENSSFGQLSGKIRAKEADRYLLETGLSIAEIAHRLGYSDHSTFSTAYRRWTNQTPRTTRAKLRAG